MTKMRKVKIIALGGTKEKYLRLIMKPIRIQVKTGKSKGKFVD